MDSAIFIQDQTFSLQYQNCGSGPEGIVELPAGDYYITNIEQYSFIGPIWVSIKQDNWKEPIQIRLSDFLKFHEYNHYV